MLRSCSSRAAKAFSVFEYKPSSPGFKELTTRFNAVLVGRRRGRRRAQMQRKKSGPPSARADLFYKSVVSRNATDLNTVGSQDSFRHFFNL
jgi:hypothetical protein